MEAHGAYNPVFGGKSGLGEVGVHKLDCVRDRLGICFGVNNFETTVDFQGRYDIESVVSPMIPRFALGLFVLYDDAAAQRTHGREGEVEVAVEMFPCRHDRVKR